MIEVANSIWEEIESTRSVSDHQLSVLHFLFGKNLQKAAKMVDQRCVKKISGEPSGRFVFQVVGESRKKEEYLCFPEHYCGCYSFFYDIVNRGELRIDSMPSAEENSHVHGVHSSKTCTAEIKCTRPDPFHFLDIPHIVIDDPSVAAIDELFLVRWKK